MPNDSVDQIAGADAHQREFIERLASAGADPADQAEFARAWTEQDTALQIPGYDYSHREPDQINMAGPVITAFIVDPRPNDGDPLADRGYLGLKFELSGMLVEFTGERDTDKLIEQATTAVAARIRAAALAAQVT